MDWIVSDQPVELVERDDGVLHRPEDVAFSRDGRLMAVANSEDDAVTLYRCDDGSGFDRAQPVQVLRDSGCLGYVHGVDISADGLFLAAVGRETHSLALFARPDADALFSPHPVWVAQGETYGLRYPSGVAFHPSGRNLVVCNRMGSPALAFFVRTPRTSRNYGYSALRSVSREAIAGFGLEAPHGLAYSPDGGHLAMCHSYFFKSSERSGRSGISMLAFNASSNSLDVEAPSMIRLEGGAYLHSLAFHPSGALLGVTNINEQATIYANDDCRELRSTATVFHARSNGGEGPKGIGFTPDGLKIAVTTPRDTVQLHTVEATRLRTAESA